MSQLTAITVGLGLWCGTLSVQAQLLQPQADPGIGAIVADPNPPRSLRGPDGRVRPELAAIEPLGIRIASSKRLELYTDMPQETADKLPPVIDQVFPQWESFFGPMRPNRALNYQITGVVFRDEDRFAKAKLLPEGLLNYQKGRHRGQQFWMADVESDYYRRHLIIHEATHCFMTSVPYSSWPDLWYLEGMAEYFATHRQADDGTVTFGVYPDRPENFRGWGRIETIQDEVRFGRQLNLRDAAALDASRFADDRQVPYAWSWAMCAFLDGHPKYHDRFRALAKNLEGEAFQTYFGRAFGPDRLLLAAEFHEFARRITYGYDFGRNAFINSSHVTTLFQDTQVRVRANQGWQSTGIQVSPGMLVELTASGSVQLAQSPGPWTSEPHGISIRYCDGVPIGTLLGALLPAENSLEENEIPQLQIGIVGNGTTLTVTRPSVLYFRVNDFANEIAGNVGEYTVNVHPVPSQQ